MNRTVAWITGVAIAVGLVSTIFLLLAMLFISAPATFGGVVFAGLYAAVGVLLLRLLPIWPALGGAKKTWLWVLACLAFGGGFAMLPAFVVAAPVMAAVQNLGWSAAEMSFGGAYPEEPGKALGVLLIVLAFRGLNRPWHGLATGALVGLGFEVVENVTYGTMMALLHPSSDVSGMLDIWGMRVFYGPFMHVTWTALAGWGIGLAIFVAGKSAWWRVGVALKWLAVAFALHFLWNYQGSTTAMYATMIAAAVIMYPLIIWLLIRASRLARADRSYVYTPGALTSLGGLPRGIPLNGRHRVT